jgi:dihydropteroate synthase
MAMARLGDVGVGDGRPVMIIGALNLSPDSFYRESIVRSVTDAVRRAREMVEQGASVIDIGAMSTGPRSKPIPAKREMHELIPAVKSLTKTLDVPISADTQRAEVAEAAIGAGAAVVNDISGLKADSKMAEVITRTGCSALLMATRHAPGDVYEIGEIKRALKGSLNICREHGISLNRVVIDPAIGYWPARLARLGSSANKRLRGYPYSFAAFLDLRILARLRELKSLGSPICVGISRKSFIGGVLGLPRPEERLMGSLAAAAIAVLNGASAVRTHDVRETLQAVRLAEAIRDVGGRT